MKVVQRDTQLITCNTSGDLIEPCLSDVSIGVAIDKTKKYSLMGFSVIFEYDSDCHNGSIEVEIRDFFAVDLENERATTDYLFDLVKASVDNGYKILAYECGKYGKTPPAKREIKETEIMSLISFELAEFYEHS